MTLIAIEALCREYLELERRFYEETQQREPSPIEIGERTRILEALRSEIAQRAADGEAVPDWFRPADKP